MVREELLSASDSAIAEALAYADPMILRGLLYQLTGDEQLLTMPTTTDALGTYFLTRFSDESDAERMRQKAVDYLKAYRDEGAGAASLGPSSRLLRSLSLTTGLEIPAADRDIWVEQSAVDLWARSVEWRQKPSLQVRNNFRVCVIGSGLAGLAAAVQLQRAGIPFSVFEKNSGVGGTWLENEYPGARVDSPSRGYSHSFGVNFPFPYAFSTRDENLRYIHWVADTFDLRKHITFETEVESVIWDETAAEWEVSACGPQGEIRQRFNAVISCVGFLSRPKMPEIAGMESFEGVACHTSRWPRGLDITGKRVAIVGSGASGYQTAPEIAKLAAHTYFFQRTPSWCYETSYYVNPLPPQVQWLDRNFPYYVNFSRARLSAFAGPDTLQRTARRDPNFKDEHTGSEHNKKVREQRIEFIRTKLANRPELIDRMIPSSPPMSSRPVLIDEHDSIFEALLRDDFTLVSEPIEKTTAAGIKTGNSEYAVDIILYATGFRANDFLWPMTVRGRNGVPIEELWAKDGPRAYIGTMLPGFPNFFMAYGPNTNNFGGFTQVDLIEIQIRFALECIAGLLEQNRRWVDVTPDAYWRYNAEVDREEALMLYMDRRANTYFTNEHGRSSGNCPIDFRRIWKWLRFPTSASQAPVDAGVKPHFDEDLVIG